MEAPEHIIAPLDATAKLNDVAPNAYLKDVPQGQVGPKNCPPRRADRLGVPINNGAILSAPPWANTKIIAAKRPRMVRVT